EGVSGTRASIPNADYLLARTSNSCPYNSVASRNWTRFMSRGRKPLGERALTAAERSARYRATHQDGAPCIRYRTPADRRSKAQRWRDAAAELGELQEDYQGMAGGLAGEFAGERDGRGVARHH